MADPCDLATALFGEDPDRLDGWWVCEACWLKPTAGPCQHEHRRRFRPRPAPATRASILAWLERSAGGGS